MSQIVQLWKRARGGAAFEERVREHVPRLFGLAWRLTRSTPDAEELVQETLLRAYTRREQFLGLDAPGPWLARVCQNLWVDRWRRLGALRDSESMDDDRHAPGREPATSDQQLLDSVDVAMLMDTCATLPEHHRLVILLHDGAGYTMEEIAELLEVPVGTTKSRLHRAREALRRKLGEGTAPAAAACVVS